MPASHVPGTLRGDSALASGAKAWWQTSTALRPPPLAFTSAPASYATEPRMTHYQSPVGALHNHLRAYEPLGRVSCLPAWPRTLVLHLMPARPRLPCVPAGVHIAAHPTARTIRLDDRQGDRPWIPEALLSHFLGRPRPCYARAVPCDCARLAPGKSRQVARESSPGPHALYYRHCSHAAHVGGPVQTLMLCPQGVGTPHGEETPVHLCPVCAGNLLRGARTPPVVGKQRH